ncbi:MAG: DUF3011 domain-containing protein [Candidatus Competibacteraceae bacterium]
MKNPPFAFKSHSADRPSSGWRAATLLAPAVLLLALAHPAPSHAQPYDDSGWDGDRREAYGGYRDIVRCESTGGYRHCRADTRRGVQLHRQLSRKACRYNDTWGHDRRGVWVDNGCRGDFRLHAGGSGGDGPEQDRDHTAAIVGGIIALGVLGAILAEKGRTEDSDRPHSLVRCESDGRYRHCRADTRHGVRLYRQLSRASCRYNDTWGHDRRGVWVDNGCRAEFALN